MAELTPFEIHERIAADIESHGPAVQELFGGMVPPEPAAVFFDGSGEIPEGRYEKRDGVWVRVGDAPRKSGC